MWYFTITLYKSKMDIILYENIQGTFTKNIKYKPKYAEPLVETVIIIIYTKIEEHIEILKFKAPFLCVAS